MSNAFISSYKILPKNERKKLYNKLANEFIQNKTKNMRRLQIQRLLAAMAIVEGKIMINNSIARQQQEESAILMANALADRKAYTDEMKLTRNGGKYRQRTKFQRRPVLTRKRKSFRSK